MNTLLLDQILLSLAVLTAGIVYGTDAFHAVAGKKALSHIGSPSDANINPSVENLTDRISSGLQAKSDSFCTLQGNKD